MNTMALHSSVIKHPLSYENVEEDELKNIKKSSQS